MTTPTINQINEALQQAVETMKDALEEIVHLKKENEKLQQILGFSIKKGELDA